MSNVVYLDTDADIPPSRVIDGAGQQEFENVIVLGWLKNGELYGAASTGDLRELLLLLEVQKKLLMDAAI